MVAVGFNPRLGMPRNGFVAERRSKHGDDGTHSIGGAIAWGWFNRRSATRWFCVIADRGLKPTATVGRSLRDQNIRVLANAATSSLLAKQLGFLRVVFPIEGLGEFGGGVGALGAVGEHGDVDDLVFDAGAAAVVAGGAEAEPVVASQPREEQAQPAVRLHVEPDRAVFVAERQPMVAVGFNPRIRMPREWFVAERRLNMWWGWDK